jgi:Na+/H+ antiporter NhaB
MGANNSVPANYSTAAYALIGLDIVFTIAAVTGRTASRKLMKATPAIDDYLCYIAFVSILSCFFCSYTDRVDRQSWTPCVRLALDSLRGCRF